jgi:hypothetical protein
LHQKTPSGQPYRRQFARGDRAQTKYAAVDREVRQMIWGESFREACDDSNAMPISRLFEKIG